MINLKKLIALGALSLAPVFAYADLTIINNTDQDGTAKVGNICSWDLLMQSGIVYKHSTYTGISSSMIDEKHMCKGLTPCIAYVYPNTRCKNNPIASFTLVGGHITQAVNNDLANYSVIWMQDSNGNDIVTINPASAGWATR